MASRGRLTPPASADGLFVARVFLEHPPREADAPQAIESPALALENFCVFGLVSCLVVASAAAFVAPELFLRARNPMLDVEHLLAGAMALLNEEQAFDMLEASSWPFRSLDLMMLHGNFAKEAARQTGDAWGGRRRCIECARGEVVLYDRAAAVRGEWGQPRGARQFLPVSHWPIFGGADGQGPRASARPEGRRLAVAAFGLHGTLKMEPAAALRAALPAVRFDLRVLGTDCRPGERTRAASCRLLCALQGRCDLARGLGDDALGLAMTKVLDAARGPTLAAYRDAVRALQARARGAEELQGLDLLICADGIYCTLLALGAAPMLLYISHVLVTPGALPDAQRELLAALRRELQPGESRAVAAVAHYNMAMWALYSAGLRLPLARTEALYLGNLTYAPERGRGVLFARTRYWQSYAGVHFRGLFNRILQWNMLEGSVNATFLQDADFLEFEEVATFEAAVLMPTCDYVMSFDELYSLGVPLLMASKEWLVRVWLRSSYTTHDARTFSPQVRLPEALALEASGALDPYFVVAPFTTPLQQRPGDFRVVYWWYDLSPFALYPFVQEFDSVPDLVYQLLHLNPARLRAVSRGMQEHVRMTRRHTLAWYRRALEELLGPR